MRSYRAGLLLGLILCVPLAIGSGCESGGLRNTSAIEAEKACLETTVPFAEAYKRDRPAEAQGVDDFYATWRGRLAKEAAAVQP
jgi:hypothetical protein